MVAHRSLSNADLHEPKDINTAAAGAVYIATGNGTGRWRALPASGFDVFVNFYTSNSTWTKPEDHIGSLVLAVGGGGGGTGNGTQAVDPSGGDGGNSTFANVNAKGGQGAQKGPTSNGAGGGATGGDINVPGFSVTAETAFNNPSPGITFLHHYGFGGTGSVSGGGGGGVLKWYTSSELSARETVRVGGGGARGSVNGTAGHDGYIIVLDFVKD